MNVEQSAAVGRPLPSASPTGRGNSAVAVEHTDSTADDSVLDSGRSDPGLVDSRATKPLRDVSYAHREKPGLGL